MNAGVVPVDLSEEEVLLSWMEQGPAGEGLPVGQALRQGLASRLRQQQQADDAQQGAAGEDNVMQEVALLVVELHDGGSEHAKASAGQDQAQPSTPAQTGTTADSAPRQQTSLNWGAVAVLSLNNTPQDGASKQTGIQMLPFFFHLWILASRPYLIIIIIPLFHSFTSFYCYSNQIIRFNTLGAASRVFCLSVVLPVQTVCLIPRQ